MKYEPTLESVRKHTVPDWFHDAKLGIFVHWGLYSVPAWATPTGELGKIEWKTWFANNPYAEWYMNTMRIEGSPTAVHHAKTYGAEFAYTDFIPMFNEVVQGWDPNEMAALFKQVGARYVVLTTKHHDGFLLWPSEHPNPFLEGHQAERDLVGDLTGAVRDAGMRMGLYYSGGIDWTFNPQVIEDIADLPKAVPQSDEYTQYADHHWRELIARYKPALMWNDIAYPAAADLGALFADYYNSVPEGVINDRFTQHFEFKEGEIGGTPHEDFRTPEYASFDHITEEKWEATRGIGFSFGYNQLEGPEAYLSVEELVRSFVDIVSKNGNLLLNVGPMADGTIPEMQRERLLGLGQWLDVNGEAIFGTRPWRVAEGRTVERRDQGGENDVRFTASQDGAALYAILVDRPSMLEIELDGLIAAKGTHVTLLGSDKALEWEQWDGALTIMLDEALPDAPAHAFKIEPPPQAGEILLALGAAPL
jgi:alpha-L-fucosidase